MQNKYLILVRRTTFFKSNFLLMFEVNIQQDISNLKGIVVMSDRSNSLDIIVLELPISWRLVK